MARVLNFICIFLILSCFHARAGVRNLDKLYEKASFAVGGRKIEAYIADNDRKREQGLMYIEKMPENTGMLFVFEQERPLGFWMKNTLIPLQIAFLDREGRIVDIQEMEIASSVLVRDVPTYQSRKPALFALEMNKGWFTRNNVKQGERLLPLGRVRSGSLNKLLPPATKQTRQ